MNGIAESKGRWIDVDKRDMQVCSGNFMLQVQRSRYGNPVSDGISIKAPRRDVNSTLFPVLAEMAACTASMA